MDPRVHSFIEPEDIEIRYSVGGVEKTARFTISGIPAWWALPLRDKTNSILRSGDFSSLPEDIVIELLKYAASGDETLGNVKTIDRYCENAEVVLALAVAVWKKNFGFFNTRKFPKGSSGSGGDSSGLIEYVGIDPLFATVIHHGHATLWEIKNRYTLEDIYNIWESDFVPDENETRLRRRAIEDAKNKRKGR